MTYRLWWRREDHEEGWKGPGHAPTGIRQSELVAGGIQRTIRSIFVPEGTGKCQTDLNCDEC